jgi:hypothetical protein
MHAVCDDGGRWEEKNAFSSVSHPTCFEKSVGEKIYGCVGQK